MKKQADAMVMAAFIGDSLALGAHWIYDVDRIRKDFGRVDLLVEAAKAQTRMTHRDPQVVECARFFASVCSMVLAGASPLDAIKTVAERAFGLSPIRDWVAAGIQSTGKESPKAIAGFGQTCHAAEAFPGVIHLIAKYESDLKEALVQAVMAGGDNAARAMAVGMVLGARLGWEGIPTEWLSGLKKRDEIQRLMDGAP